MRAIVTGRLRQRSYETKEGENRTVYELEADDIGPALSRATAKVTKVSRSGNGDGSGEAASDGAASADWPVEPPF